jgi:hypothetical protein
MPRRNLKYSTDWHLLTRQNSYNASKQKRHNANDTNQFMYVQQQQMFYCQSRRPERADTFV